MHKPEGETQPAVHFSMPMDYILPMLREEMVRNAQMFEYANLSRLGLKNLVAGRKLFPGELEMIQQTENTALKHGLRAVAIVKALEILGKEDWLPTDLDHFGYSRFPLPPDPLLVELREMIKELDAKHLSDDPSSQQLPGQSQHPKP